MKSFGNCRFVAFSCPFLVKPVLRFLEEKICPGTSQVGRQGLQVCPHSSGTKWDGTQTALSLFSGVKLLLAVTLLNALAPGALLFHKKSFFSLFKKHVFSTEASEVAQPPLPFNGLIL